MYLEKLHIEKPVASSGIRTPNLPTLKQQCRTLHRNQLGGFFFASTRSGASMGKTMKSDEDQQKLTSLLPLFPVELLPTTGILAK